MWIWNWSTQTLFFFNCPACCFCGVSFNLLRHYLVKEGRRAQILTFQIWHQSTSKLISTIINRIIQNSDLKTISPWEHFILKPMKLKKFWSGLRLSVFSQGFPVMSGQTLEKTFVGQVWIHLLSNKNSNMFLLLLFLTTMFDRKQEVLDQLCWSVMESTARPELLRASAINLQSRCLWNGCSPSPASEQL